MEATRSRQHHAAAHERVAGCARLSVLPEDIGMAVSVEVGHADYFPSKGLAMDDVARSKRSAVVHKGVRDISGGLVLEHKIGMPVRIEIGSGHEFPGSGEAMKEGRSVHRSRAVHTGAVGRRCSLRERILAELKISSPAFPRLERIFPPEAYSRMSLLTNPDKTVYSVFTLRERHSMPNSFDSPLLYQKIYQDIEKKIVTGELRYMEQIPVLPDLCKVYGVSEAPVRRAIDELSRAGLVVKRRGRGQGTFVIKRLIRATVRVLLLADFDIHRSTQAACHEVFDLMAGVHEAAREAGCEVQQVSREGFDHLPRAGVGTGYLVIAMSAREYRQGIALAESQSAPCVLLNPPSAEGKASVRVDMELGAFLGVNYLAQLGHRRIAYVGGVHSEWALPRLQGYRNALASNGLTADPALVRDTNGIDAEQDAVALDSLMALAEPPTAIFAGSDYRALHLLAHGKQRGIRVPQDLSLCGYDNISEVANIEPALTTVHHPLIELGKVGVELLLERLTAVSPMDAPMDRLIKPQLMVRDSCASPRR